jgi:hypothetical protein
MTAAELQIAVQAASYLFSLAAQHADAQTAAELREISTRAVAITDRILARELARTKG